DPIPKGGKPFLTVKLYEGNQFGDHLIIRDDAEHPTIEFIIQIENRGESDAIVWESDFASRKQLEANRFAVKPAIFECRPKKTGQKLSELLRETPLELPYRLVYHPVGHDDEIYAVEMTAKITNEKV